MSALQAFRTDFCLMWERKETKSIDVTTDHAQTTPSYHALNQSWGEHCIILYYAYLKTTVLFMCEICGFRQSLLHVWLLLLMAIKACKVP